MKHEIVPVLEHYGGYIHRDRYGWQKIRCPFHDDGHASATVNTDENAFNCFGCGIKGDTYSIIMQHEGVGFSEALKVAERITGTSSDSLRKEYRSSGRIFSESGNHLRRRAYSPPRLSRRSANGA